MIERCAYSMVTIPECSCEHCLRAMVETHAPQVRPVAEIITLRPREAMTGERPSDPRAMHGVG